MAGAFANVPNASDIGEPNTIDPFVGTTIGHRYQIDSVLGQGGWSTVYSGIDLTIQRPVAVKILHHHLAGDTETVKRFRREAEAAGCINNPHVVTIFDSGVSPSGQPYIVMELLKGESLAELLMSQQRLPVKRAVDIFIQACEGLYAAHQKGVIHRDLKPSNILVQREPQADFVKVLDFGLAKFSPAERNKEDLTATGVSFGTPSYMSPEQCQGHALDQRSDIYSLGCVMYRALTGQKATDSDNIYTCMSKQVLETPKAFKEAMPDLYVPESLERIVFKALAKDPAERFSTMDELRSALQKFRSGTSSMPGLVRGGTVCGPPPIFLLFVILGLAVVVTMYVQGIVHQSQEQPAREKSGAVAAGGSPLAEPKSVPAGVSPLVNNHVRTSTPVQPPNPAPKISGEEWLRRKPQILHAESMLDPILQMLGLPVEPLPTSNFVPDPDTFDAMSLKNKMELFQRVAPSWASQSGQGMQLQQIVGALQDIDKHSSSMPQLEQMERRSVIIDRALGFMGVQAPPPEPGSMPSVFYLEGVQKRTAHKMKRIEIVAPDWIAHGGNRAQLQAMVQQFMAEIQRATAAN
ncbi:MAG TPA: serine/threonine-protein kinase [Candidatus Obscuribacterales bacterium]